jgi:hypothetical protein
MVTGDWTHPRERSGNADALGNLPETSIRAQPVEPWLAIAASARSKPAEISANA